LNYLRWADAFQEQGQKEGEPGEEPSEIVADGGEDGIDGITGAMGEVIAVHAVVFCEMTDDGLDGGAALENALDLGLISGVMPRF